VEGIISGTIKYHNDKTNTTESFDFAFDSLKDEASGTCGDDVQTLTAQFAVNDIASQSTPWTLTIRFNRTENSTKEEDGVFDVLDYSLTTDKAQGLNITGKTYHPSKDAEVKVEAHLQHAYKCSVTGFALEDESTLPLRAGRIIAFAFLNDTKFPENAVDLCFLDAKTADIVPIVVGLCLAALILIVLIAYCIGRARARREGYSSV